MARTDARKRGAAPRNGGGGSSRRWPLFVGGLASGLVVAGAIWLAGILPTAMELRERVLAHEAECAQPAAPAGGNGKADTITAKGSEKPLRFDFYTLLPQQEVVAPVTGNRTTTAATPPPVANGSAPATTAATAGTERFLLQAGSFRTRGEADRRRAELLLSGHSVNVQDVTTGNGEQWFRVMVGPFETETGMQKARQQLAAARVDTLPIRLK